MYYPMGNFVPWRTAAWAVLSERVAVLAQRCAAAAELDGVPDAASAAAGRASGIAAGLAAQVPAELRPAAR
jgi:hypothetical protein